MSLVMIPHHCVYNGGDLLKDAKIEVDKQHEVCDKYED